MNDAELREYIDTLLRSARKEIEIENKLRSIVPSGVDFVIGRTNETFDITSQDVASIYRK